MRSCSNALCLLLNDATLGIMLSIFLQDNNTFLCRALASAIQVDCLLFLFSQIFKGFPTGWAISMDIQHANMAGLLASWPQAQY